MAIGNYTLPGAPYPLLDNVTNLFQYIRYVDVDLSGGLFSFGFLLALAVVSFIGFKQTGHSTPRALVGTAWITGLGTILLGMIGILDVGSSLVFATILLIMAGFMSKHQEKTFE